MLTKFIVLERTARVIQNEAKCYPEINSVGTDGGQTSMWKTPRSIAHDVYKTLTIET